MSCLRWISGATFGAVVTATLILACSDDAPGPADASVCDCPAAEPPLDGRVIEVSVPASFAAPGGGAGVNCPMGSLFMGGSCLIDALGPGPGTVSLQEAGQQSPGNYSCSWNSTIAAVSTTRAVARCLVPPS